MSRLLFVSWDGGGNTPSAYHLGARLAGRGHAVAMMGWRAMTGPARAAGLAFSEYPSVPPWPPDLRHEDGWARVQSALSGHATEDDIVAEGRVLGADALVVDCMLTAGYAAARRLGVPVVSLVHPLYVPFVHEWGSQVLGVDVGELLGQSVCVLALQPPGLDVPTELPNGTAYVGAVLRHDTPRPLPQPTQDLLNTPGDPWVVLSLSTTLQGQREALPGLLASLAPLPIRVLLTLGGVLDPSSVTAPNNATVRASIPHEQLLPRVAALVTHGGMSSVATSLASGTPMVCIPQGRDQPLNAARVEAVGAGLHLAPDAPAGEIAAAVMTVLTDSRFGSVAAEFADRTASLGNGRHAADLVEQLTLNLPVVPS